MLIDYSIRSFEVLERKLAIAEKEETFNTFYRVGLRMGVKGLPGNYQEWLIMRADHLQNNLACGDLTRDLYKQYNKHLGFVRYQLLSRPQVLVVPQRVNDLLLLGKIPLLTPVLHLYKLSRMFRLEGMLKNIILPKEYKKQISELDVNYGGEVKPAC